MISSQIHQYIENVDEIIGPDSEDFRQSGLKIKSVIRTTRVAVADENILFGTIGEISKERLNRIRENLVNWIKSSGDPFDEEKFHEDG
ncbi:MAG: hypothetical protein ACE5I1_20285 [bacterium]